MQGGGSAAKPSEGPGEIDDLLSQLNDMQGGSGGGSSAPQVAKPATRVGQGSVGGAEPASRHQAPKREIQHTGYIPPDQREQAAVEVPAQGSAAPATVAASPEAVAGNWQDCPWEAVTDVNSGGTYYWNREVG